MLLVFVIFPLGAVTSEFKHYIFKCCSMRGIFAVILELHGFHYSPAELSLKLNAAPALQKKKKKLLNKYTFIPCGYCLFYISVK